MKEFIQAFTASILAIVGFIVGTSILDSFTNEELVEQCPQECSLVFNKSDETYKVGTVVEIVSEQHTYPVVEPVETLDFWGMVIADIEPKEYGLVVKMEL